MLLIFACTDSWCKICPKFPKKSTRFTRKNSCAKINTVLKSEFTVWSFAAFYFKTIIKLHSELRPQLIYSYLIFSLCKNKNWINLKTNSSLRKYKYVRNIDTYPCVKVVHAKRNYTNKVFISRKKRSMVSH